MIETDTKRMIEKSRMKERKKEGKKERAREAAKLLKYLYLVGLSVGRRHAQMRGEWSRAFKAFN